MQKYPQIQSLKEANLLLGTRRTFGIYQIKDDSPGENYAFMNMSFIESHSMQIKKEDYKLVYVGELLGNTSLDDIFERFNIDRPKDFRGHSLSVSDIVVLNDGEKVTAHFVDSISFEQLDSFLNLEEQVLDELAWICIYDFHRWQEKSIRSIRTRSSHQAVGTKRIYPKDSGIAKSNRNLIVRCRYE